MFHLFLGFVMYVVDFVRDDEDESRYPIKHFQSRHHHPIKRYFAPRISDKRVDVL